MCLLLCGIFYGDSLVFVEKENNYVTLASDNSLLKRKFRYCSLKTIPNIEGVETDNGRL